MSGLFALSLQNPTKLSTIAFAFSQIAAARFTRQRIMIYDFSIGKLLQDTLTGHHYLSALHKDTESEMKN
jgi:hypothetical protein